MNTYVYILACILVLYFGKFLFLPLLFALLTFIILKSLSNKLSTYKLYKFSINENLSLTIVCSFVFIIIYLLGVLIEINLSNVLNDINKYQINTNNILSFLEKNNSNSPFLSFEKIFKNINLAVILSKTLNFITGLAGNFSLVLLFLIFFILEEKFLKIKIKKINSKTSTKNILKKINNQIYSYFQIKLLTSIFTGVLTFLILIFYKSDLAVFFGILSLLLNFIPFIGSLLSIILPFCFSIIQNLNIFESFSIFILLTITQVIIGNLLEPKLMGKSLNLSPLIMLITLSLMGKIWGLSGMFVSVPILVILLIVFSNFKKTQRLAIILSEKGHIN